MNNEIKSVVPAATLCEEPEGYEFKIMIPGIAKEDADLHLDGRTLTLKTHSKFQVPAGFKAAVTEFERANYAISADLPEMADASTLAARLENGVLTVTLRKRAEAAAKKIMIS